LRPVELGASIFVSANKNLWRATSTEGWNLTRDDFDYEQGYDTGIWNGSEFLLVIGGSSGIGGWWETLKVIWRYGWSAPTRTQNMCVACTIDGPLLINPQSEGDYQQISDTILTNITIMDDD
jgi:hypothetical protein